MKFCYILIFTFLFNSCGKFNLSPFINQIETRDLNIKNISWIKKREILFKDQYKVAVISDSHNYYSDLKRQINYINMRQDEYAFVVHTGDATNLGLPVEWEMFLEIMDDLKVPYLMVVGNHDLLMNGEKIYKQVFGKSLDFRLEFKHSMFAFMNNNNWESERKVPDLETLTNRFLGFFGYYRFVFAHVPPNDSDRFTQKEIENMEDVANRFQINYFLHGHNHNYGEDPFGDSVMIGVGSSSKNKLLELIITNNGVTHNVVPL